MIGFFEFAGCVILLVVLFGLMGWAQYRRWLWWSDRQDKKNAFQTLFTDKK